MAETKKTKTVSKTRKTTSKSKSKKVVEPALQDVKFLTSIALAVNDVDDVVKHCQFVVVQDIVTKELKCFFDVVDVSQVKLANPDGLSGSDNA